MEDLTKRLRTLNITNIIVVKNQKKLGRTLPNWFMSLKKKVINKKHLWNGTKKIQAPKKSANVFKIFYKELSRKIVKDEISRYHLEKKSG